MTINTQKLREAAAGAKEFASVGVVQWPHTAKAHINGLADTVTTCCGEIDAQTAEIAKAHSQVERWKKVAESAEDRAQVAADEIERLRGALRWAAGALQMACEAGEIMREADGISINNETRTVAQILDAADAALAQEQGESDGNQD